MEDKSQTRIEQAMAISRKDAMRRIAAYRDLAAEHLAKLLWWGKHPTIGKENEAGWLNTINNKYIPQIYKANSKDSMGKNTWLDYPGLLEALDAGKKENFAEVVAHSLLRLLNLNWPDPHSTYEAQSVVQKDVRRVSRAVDTFVKHCLTNMPIKAADLDMVEW